MSASTVSCESTFDIRVLEKDHEVVREEARDLMRQIQAKGVEYDPDRKVNHNLIIY